MNGMHECMYIYCLSTSATLPPHSFSISLSVNDCRSVRPPSLFLSTPGIPLSPVAEMSPSVVHTCQWYQYRVPDNTNSERAHVVPVHTSVPVESTGHGAGRRSLRRQPASAFPRAAGPATDRQLYQFSYINSFEERQKRSRLRKDTSFHL